MGKLPPSRSKQGNLWKGRPRPMEDTLPMGKAKTSQQVMVMGEEKILQVRGRK